MQCSNGVMHEGLEEGKDVCICTKELGHSELQGTLLLPHICTHGFTWTGDDDITPPKTSEVDWEDEIEGTRSWEDFLRGIIHRDKDIKGEMDMGLVLSLEVYEGDEEHFSFHLDSYGPGAALATQVGMLEWALARTKEQLMEGNPIDNSPEL